MRWTRVGKAAKWAAAVLVVSGVATPLVLNALSAEQAKAGAPRKKSGEDSSWGDGVVYKREVLFGSFAKGNLDGPPTEVELYGAVGCRMPNGDWYVLEEDVTCGLYKYDARKKRVITLSAGAPYGKFGGTIETLRLARGGYMRSMGMAADPSGKFLKIYDRNNNGCWWQVDLESGSVEPAPGAASVQGSAVRGGTPDGSLYFAMGDGKLKKLLPDGRTVRDLGVTLEGPLSISTFSGDMVVSEKTGRLFAMSRDPQGPWGIVWYWDMKTGKATGIAGPKKGETPDKAFNCASGPADKVSFWCASGVTLGPDMGERYVYLGGGDESTCSRIDIEKKYVTKMIPADARDRSLWTFGEGRQNKEYRFGDPYCWPGAPGWGGDGEYYMSWALCTKIEIYRPVNR